MSIDLTFRFDGIEEACEALERSVDAELETAMTMVGAAVAYSARREHDYQNRTGDLESSTTSFDASGVFSDGTLVVRVVGDTEYGEYVDARKPFLMPAFQSNAQFINDQFDAALRMAVQRTMGWSSR